MRPRGVVIPSESEGSGRAGGARGFHRAAWNLGVAFGLLPLLLLGFLASAVADRLWFFGWGLAAGAVWTTVLRAGLLLVWPQGRLLGSLAFSMALALSTLGLLAGRFEGDLTVGLKAVVPNAARVLEVFVLPRNLFLSAGLFAIFGLIVFLRGNES